VESNVMVDMNQTTEYPLEKTYLRQAMTVLNAFQIMKARDLILWQQAMKINVNACFVV
jgi:hypothetical protein